jgi:uncharacterized protein (TIGR02145 family)
MRKLILTTAALAAAILLLVATPVLMKSMDYSYKSGATTVKLSKDMTRLRVCGKGAMADYGGYFSGNSPDWGNASHLITDLIIENGVTHIGAYAFSGLSEAAAVTIPNSVTSIGDWAFGGRGRLSNGVNDVFENACTSLTTIAIPSNVAAIGARAFSGCTGMTSITVAADNAYFTSEDGVLFNKDKTVLLQYPHGKQQNAYTIPNSVTSIGEGAFSPGSAPILCTDTMKSFSDTAGLTFITLPDDLTSIGDWAFYGLTGLMSMTIPNSVTSIGEMAFSYSVNLKSVTIPAGAVSIGNWAFHACINLSSVTYLNPVPPDISEGTFSGLPDNACLYVPANSISAYRAADVWKDFKCIKTASAYTYELTGTFTDTRDKQTYRTVVIGGKRWMAQNLNYQTDSSWCYQNSADSCEKYGRLYNWDAAVKACPAGYHLPSREEWDNLGRAIGDEGNKYINEGDDKWVHWLGAAKKLKSKSGWNWNKPDNKSGNGTDRFGFSALPGGQRDYRDLREYTNGRLDRFGGTGYFGRWWTATEDNGDAYYLIMQIYSDHAGEKGYLNCYVKNDGYSVRCVADRP